MKVLLNIIQSIKKALSKVSVDNKIIICLTLIIIVQNTIMISKM